MRRSSDRKARRIRKGTETSAIQIIEEAFHLVRSAPVSSLWLYFFGTVPFVCLLFYFFADMSRSSYADRDAGLVALGLALAFFWKCSWQARFCRSLWKSINPGYTPQKTGWQKFRYHAAIWLFQAFSIPVIFLAICFVIPLAWVMTTFQNGYALGLSGDYGKTPLRKLASHAAKNSHYQWAQNHGIWVTMGFIGLLTWANIYAACTLPPQIGKTFFGIESVFTTNPAALTNSTFVFGTLLMTYLILSPLLKGIFVLRCFYADSRTTGSDLLSRLAELRERRSQVGEPRTPAASTAKQKAAALIAGITILFSGISEAQEKGAPPTPNPGSASSLDVAIQDTMASKKYQWKFSRKIEIETGDEEKSWLQTQLAHLGDAVETRMRIFRAWLSDKMDELFDKLRSGDRKSKQTKSIPTLSASATDALMNIGWGILIVVIAGLVGWLIFVLIKYHRIAEEIESEESGSIADIDLESEDIVADQFHEDEWLKLAREQISKGESRLAIRALFLATLSHLGEKGLLKIQKYKSNRDYRQELELKARQKANLREAFSENTGLFERAWYGLHQIGDESIDHFMKNYETITDDPA